MFERQNYLKADTLLHDIFLARTGVQEVTMSVRPSVLFKLVKKELSIFVFWAQIKLSGLSNRSLSSISLLRRTVGALNTSSCYPMPQA